MKISWIGTGVMGSPMARHLQKGGYDVVAYNRTFSKAKLLEPEIKAVETIEEAIHDADIIFSIVGYPEDVKEVAYKVFEHAKPQTIFVDMTTSSPSLAKTLYEEGKKYNIRVVDAPVTGGDLGAINATLSIMVGGDIQDFEAINPLLQLLGKTINYMGTAGNGQHAKLANQTAIAGAIAACAEALSYAKAHNLDTSTMLSVITGGSANSWQATNNGPKMINGDMQPGFFAKHFLKDLRLACAEKGLVTLPVLEKVTEIYEYLVENGYGDDGTQAIINYYK